MCSLFEKFMSKVDHCQDTDTCWPWKTSLDTSGYGQMRINRVMRKANRIAYELFVGPIPNGLCVLHSCDNPACVNPSHLWIGTQQDNGTDKARKGRGRKSKTGLPYGVIRTSSGKYLAQVRYKGIKYYLGTFDSVEEAHTRAIETKQEIMDGA